ncbi:RND family transporter [Mycobacterium paraffinicum]|uniref:RND family transporter n=1 Tax=Mycobacterium paraffinicum TaxID=53378 RepID=A0ABP8RFA9_9MYCO|nr:RND family transporter [Mycobacterium paraffinicum]MCV7309386.1 RND family transporter [Mycobacterium paraffinicum]
MSVGQRRPPFFARSVRKLAMLVILAWVALTLLVSFGVPWLETVGREHSVPMAPQDAPAVQAMQRMGRDFKESDSDSFAMLVLESQQPLGDDAHNYYDQLVRKLKDDTKHIEHVQDLWSDRLTAAGAQSPDSKAVYVQLNLAGNQGTTLGGDSIAAVRHIIAQTPPPPGLTAYVTGPAALIADMQHAGDSSILKMTLIGAVIIFTVLLFVYRSIITVILLLLTVGIEVFAARGIIAFLGDHSLVQLSTFAINLLVALAMAAGTDYGIFFFGRYQEARQAGEDRETAYYTTYRGVAPVVLGSGLTIAGAMLCLSFTRMPIFQTIGVPCAVGLLASVAIALTLVPAIIAVGSGFGLLDPRRTIGFQRWRRVGTAIVRWPAPILAATIAVALVGLVTLPGYQTSYNDRAYIPKDVPANVGYAAADRHFTQSRMMPEILMIESDHDMRNPADFLVLHRLAKGIFQVKGISRVQGITRPEGTPIQHTSIPFLLSMQQATMSQDMKYMQARTDDMLKQADLISTQIATMKRLYELQKRMTEITHDTITKTKEMTVVIDEVRQHLSDFEDFFRPLRSYFYWERHCYDIPICWSLRNIFETFDGVDILADKMQQDLIPDLDKMDVLMPQLLEQYPTMIAIAEDMRSMILTMHSTMAGTLGQMTSNDKDAVAMGEAFDASKNDDSFYLPPDIFENADFKRAMNNFLSPDGKAARFIISHRGDPATPEGVSRIDQIRTAAEESLKSTPLENSKIYIAGTASTFRDFKIGSEYDLFIAGVGALCLIFIIMLVITRSFVAALVIVGTVALSLGASFGLAVLIWQYLLGFKLHWMVLPMSVIILLAVGSDYNLLLVSRMKEEIAAGIKTGIIRAMGGTGKVVTNAGLVFAFTMAAMVASDLRIIGQVGTTIGLGLMFDTLIVRSFMTPSIAALLGRWFWWPQVVRPRPASQMLRSEGPRPVVRALLSHNMHEDDAPTAEIPRPAR